MLIIAQIPLLNASRHAGVGDRLGALYIPERKTHYTLAQRAGALHTQPCRKLLCIAHRIPLIRVALRIKWLQIFHIQGQLGMSGVGAQNVKIRNLHTWVHANRLLTAPIAEHSHLYLYPSAEPLSAALDLPWPRFWLKNTIYPPVGSLDSVS